ICWMSDHGRPEDFIAVLHPDVPLSGLHKVNSSRESSAASSTLPPLQSVSRTPSRENRFRLVLGLNSTASAIAKNLNLLKAPLKISPSLMELLDTAQQAASNAEHTSRRDHISDGAAFTVRDDTSYQQDINSLIAHDEDLPELAREVHSDFAVDGCGWPSSIAQKGLDLSGSWKPIVSKTFLESYDLFLQACGESYWMRKLLVNAVSMQTQQVQQYENGKRLEIVDIHPLARWNRTITASGIEHARHMEFVNEMMDPQGDKLQIVASWCGNGTIHRSVLKTSKPRLKDAWLETNRYLEQIESVPEKDDKKRPDPTSADSKTAKNFILVSESIFHLPPSTQNLRHASIVWKYERI
ncbi:MAG: hypothetical protein SGILL_010674, partial [Bacillariaceae sp.]